MLIYTFLKRNKNQKNRRKINKIQKEKHKTGNRIIKTKKRDKRC